MHKPTIPWVAVGVAALIAGMPLASQSARSVPVTVDNFPDVQAVEDVTNPAFQPYQATETNFDDITTSGITLLMTATELDPVPPGKRLVVQHLSYRVSGGEILDASCTARVRDGFDEIVAHPLPLQLGSFRTDEVYRVSLPITLYADPGQLVGVSCSVRTTDDVFQQLGVTGYFIDL